MTDTKNNTAQIQKNNTQPQVQTPERTVLDIANSVLGKKWVFTPTDDRLAQGISQTYGIPDVVSRLLVSRGINFEQVENFLNPSLKNDLPDPYTLVDMDKAAKRIADAIKSKQKITVFGDYDVDGATSTALMVRYFRSLNVDVSFYIPDRISEGYGPNATALQNIAKDGTNLLITVDCGQTAFDAIDAGTKAGMDVVILDHHRADVTLPNAHAVVNPNRLDDESGQGHMAAVGVVFLTLVAVNRVLREEKWFTAKMPEPRILQWLDLVALGTVCDIVSLTGVNRAFVAQGLKVMAMRQNEGLVALAEINNLTEAPKTFHAGFIFGPRVNAGGRIGDSDMGAKLLSTRNKGEAAEIARQLHNFNAERKAMEAEMLEIAIAQIDAYGDDLPRVIIAHGDGWHPGVIGIVAARLKEKYQRPACVVAFDENGMGKSSARSISDVDLGSAIISARQNDILIAGGGHKMAAGFTVAKDRLNDLQKYLNDHVENQMQGADYQPTLRVDQVLSIPSLTLDLVEKIDMLGPYGAGHAEPRFVVSGVKVIRPKVVGENHISCILQDTAGGGGVKAIAFRALDSDLGELLLKSGSEPLYIAGHVNINEWMGKKSVNFQIVDAARLWAE